MKILCACEESQAVTIEMRNRGHEAYSCDIEPCSGGHTEWHIQGDVTPLLSQSWDMIIAFPPCTYLSNAGIGWFNEERYGEKARQRKQNRIDAHDFFLLFANANCDKIAIENPVGYMNGHWRKPDQIIQPCMFGDEDNKRTCLWLKALPLLTATNIVEPKIYGYYKTGKKKGNPIYFNDWKPPSKDRAKLRSKTFPGIAAAMAEQWG